MKTSSILVLCAVAVLSACGGSSDNNAAPEPTPPPTSAVPASAGSSAGGFVAYLKSLVASAADTLEPVNVSSLTPQVDDLAEPTQID